MKKAIVTGAAGFIGKALVRKLIEMNSDVIAMDKMPMPDSIRCKSMQLDVSEPEVLEGLLDHETTIFHMASTASVPGSVANPRDDFKNTLYGLFEVIDTARKYKSRVIFPSTASIFDSQNSQPVSERSYVKPTSPYGSAKVAGEAYCAAFHRCYGLDVRIARMFSVYGIGMTKFAIHDMIKKVMNNHDELLILGDGNQIRDYLYIDDAVQGLIDIAVSGEPGEDYNLASGTPVRIMDLAKKIAALMGYPDMKIKPTGESFPGDIPKWYADISKISKINFTPKVSLDEGLQRTIAWMS
jgi:UDP-glucose 4-epimerase